MVHVTTLRFFTLISHACVISVSVEKLQIFIIYVPNADLYVTAY